MIVHVASFLESIGGSIDKEEIINLLTNSLKKDRTKSQILGFTKLNLLEMTRKHIFGND